MKTKPTDAPMKARVMYRGLMYPGTANARQEVYNDRKVLFRRKKSDPWKRIKTSPVLVLNWSKSGRAALREKILASLYVNGAERLQLRDKDERDLGGLCKNAAWQNILAALAPRARKAGRKAGK